MDGAALIDSSSQASVEEVRPRGVGEIADAAIEQIRMAPALVWGIYLPAGGGLVAVLLLLLAGPSYLGVDLSAQPLLLVAAALAGACLFLLRFIALGALTDAAWWLTERERTSVGSAYRSAVRSGMALLFAGSATWILSMLFGMFYMLPLVIPGLLFCLAIPVIAVEGASPVGAMSRSFELMRGHLPRAAILHFLLIVLAIFAFWNLHLGVQLALYLATALLDADTTFLAAFCSLGNGIYVFSLLAVAVLVIDPLRSLCLLNFYLDIRIRLEGFDLRRRIARILEASVRGAPRRRQTAPRRDAATPAQP